ncbi:hypothetical protein TNCV_4637461 [Trichonephila clavipes]|nr:hypothetical protein TNCV_4637461 [Trichonephila clavipes]
MKDDEVCTTKIMAGKDSLELFRGSKSVIGTDSEGENEMNIASPVTTSSEMRNIMKNMRSSSRSPIDIALNIVQLS